MLINEVITLKEETLSIYDIPGQSSISQLDKVFKNGGFELRIVGGAVRDLALNKEPKDVDLATDATQMK